MTALFSWLGSLLWQAVNWIFRLNIVKFIAFGAVFVVLEVLRPLLDQLVQSAGLETIGQAFGGLPNDVRFYLAVFKVDVGVPLVVAAALTRFFIRRLPVVG